MAKKKENTAPMLSMDQIAKNYKKQQDNKNKSTTTATTAEQPKINGVESGIILSYDKILDNWLNQQGDNAVSKITALYNKTKERNNLQTRGLPLYDKKGNMVAVPIADHTEYGRKKEREIQRLWEELVAQENRKNGNVELGSWLGTGTSNNKAKEALDTRNARQHMDWFTGAIASGNYNNTDDVTQMNQEGLNSRLAQLQQSQKDLENRLAENRKSIEAQGTVDRTLPMLSLVDNDRTRNEWAIINGEGYTEQEKAKARETLEQLWNVGSAANPSAKTLADTYLKYIDNMDGAGSTPERMRQMAYDAMNGNGAYEKVTGTMQAADKKALDDKIDNALAYIRDPNGQLGIDRRTMESQLRTVMDDIKETQRQQQIWNDYNALMNLIPQGQNANYVLDNDVMKNYDYWSPSRMTGDMDAWAYSPNADMIYSFINGGYAWEQYTAGGYREVSGIMKYAELMNSAEVEQFNKFYNAGQKNEAMAFLDGLQSALSQRYVTQYETLSTRMRAREFPVISSIMTFGDTMLQPAEFVYNLVSSIFNNDSKNAYGGNYAITRHKAVTREQVGEDLGPVGKFFYDAAMSGGDSALNMAVGKCMGLTGKAMEAATLTLFSTQAFQTSMQRNLEESNGDFGYSFLEATVDSLIETATEIYSLEALMGDPTNLIQYVLKTAAAEGSEEFVGAAFGPYVKEMLGRKNEWKTRADQILKAGGYDDGYGHVVKVNSYDEAARQAMREWNHDIVISTLSGAVSTGGGVFYGTARNIYNRAQTGRQIISPDNIKNGVSGADQILKIAGGMKEGSQSKAYADAIAKKTEKGKTPSNYEIGRLAETVWQETGEAQREVVGEITQRSVREQLVKEGVPAAEAEQYAALISGSLTGSRKLSRGDIKTLAKSESAMKVWLSYNTATEENKALNREIREATAGQRSIENTLMDLTGATAKQQSVIAGEVEQSIKETSSQEEAIDNLAQRRSELMSEDYAKLAKDLYKIEQKSKASSRYLDDIMKIRLAAMSMNQLPRTGLSQENAQKLYEAAQKEFEEKDKARIERNVILEPGKGTATFDDAEFGTDEWKEKLRSLNSNQRAQVNVLAEVARRMGMRMEFVNDPTQSGNWGWQTKETGVVTVNVAGKYSKTGLSHNMLVTMSHELTHWLEHNSVEGYNQLRQYVVDSLRRKGVNVEALMISSIDNQNLARNTAKENNVKGWERIEVLDLNGAMAEVVARSCENLLGSKVFAKEVEETNPTLFKHIQNYIKNFMVRLREAVKGMRTSLSYEATALLNETEKIAEIWLGARAEAMGRKTNVEPTLTLDEAMASPVVVFSLDSPIQMREDGMIAVHNLDERGLESDLRMGGFPMPSIAVLAKNKTWTAYGRISIFFGKDSVAPESGSILFNGDAYTPTLGDADVNTAEEALAYLMNQPQRKLHMSYSVTNMFRDFKRIRNLDEARRKAYRYQKLGPEEITKTYRMANKMEDDLFDKTDELMAAHGRKSVKNRGTGRSTIDHWIGRGMLYAAEEMEGQTGLKKEQKYEILQRNIDKAFDENEIQHFDFGSEGNDIYDMMLDYIDMASQMESGGGMMEAKPESVIPFSAVQAVVVPDTIDQALIRELIDAGMDRESIIEYDPSDLKDRARKLKEVPELIQGVSFSMEQKTFDYDQSFRDQLVSYQKLPANEKKLKNKFVLVGTTPKVLTDIGLVKLPMTLNYQHVGYMLEGSHPKDQYKEDHIFDIEVLSHLPELIADPVAVIKDSDPGSVRVLVNMKARSGKDVIVPISINSRKTVNGQWMDVNALSTGYGSGDIINELIAYLQKDSDSDPRIYYINQKKTQQVIGDKRSKLTDDFMIPDGYIRRISEKDITVNDAKYNRKKPLKTQTDTTQFNKWFGRSKVKNADGTPKIMYHGTPSQFTKFDKSKASYAGTYGKGFYFTDSVSHAAHYGNQMAVYLRAENPLKTTGHKIKREQMLRFLQAVAENDEYDFANYGYGETPESMIDKIYTGKGDLLLIQDVSSTAIGDTGEAMRLFNEVNGTHFDSIITDKETVVFQPNQIKSATDNIGTFDINSDDIRFSVEQLDQEYQEAVESGNLDRATEMLMDRLAEKEGIIPFNAPHGYSGQHRDIAKLIKEGTPEAVARAAADMAQFVPENGVLIPMPPHEGTVETETDTMILANAISKLTGRPVVVALESDPRESRYQAKSEGRKGVTSAEMGFRQVKEIPEGTMPIFVDNVVGSGVTADAARTAMGGGITLAYAKGTQSKGIEGLKRATVTYDKDGKLIPLSQRFDRSIRNVNFSMEQVAEERKDGLVAVHNLTADQLMKTLRLGGFPMPSIAVIKNDYAHDRYGDISVIFKPGAIDPKASRANKVYGGDAWTPTYPSIEYKINRKTLDGIIQNIQKILPDELKNNNELTSLYEENIGKQINNRNGDVAAAIRDNSLVKYAYLNSKGQEVDIPMRDVRLSRMSNVENAEIQQIAEMLGKDELERIINEGFRYLGEHPEIVDQIRKKLNDDFRKQILEKVKDSGKDLKLKLLEKDLYTEENFGQNRAYDVIDAAYRYLAYGIKQEVDPSELRDALDKQIDQEEYDGWIWKTFGGIIEKSGLRNNKNYFTDTGNPRSWDALHDEETLENVVRIMKQEADKGANAFFGQSAMLALGTRDFKSLKEIREHRDQLKHISDEELSEAKSNIVHEFGKLMDEMAPKSEQNIFIARDRALDAMVDAVRHSKKAEGIMRELKQWGLNVPEDAGERIEALLEEIANLPTEYFEAKPQRAVRFDEVAKVIVPENADPALFAAMREKYIPYATYDGTNEDRLAKLNEDDSYQFSMEQAPDMDVQAWMAGLTPGSLQTEDERALLQAWKDKRMSISLSIKRQLDYRAKIRRLENSADSLTPQEREDLVALRNKLQVQEEKQARLEKEMYQITSQEGFAGMMYQQNMVMRDFITGRTQDEINDTVDDMVHEVQRMAGEIAEARKDLEKLADAEDLKQAQKALKGTQLNQNAKSLKKEYRSKMTENEIQARLAEMALRMAGGESVEDVAESARELAYDLGRLQNGYLGGAYGDLADRLKQVTIVIGPTQREQLAAQHSSIPQLRRQLAGSGVKIVFDPNLRGAGTLEDIGPGSEIHDLIPELGEDTGNMMNNLDVFVGLVQGTLKNLEAEMLHDFDMDDAAMMIQGYALLASTEMQGNPAMTTQVKRLLGLAKGEGGKAGELAERLKNAQDYLKGAIDKGEQAKGLTKMLRKDVDSAISYYNKTAAVAAKVEKQKVKEGLIAQLKSQHAQDLMKEQQKWRDLIEKDKTVRAMMQQNQDLRRGITSDYTRIRKLLVNETDQKNIPEHMKSLARHMIRLLTENDLIGRKITNVQRQDLMETLRILDAMRQTDDDFTLDDLRMISDEEAQAAVAEALADLEDGIKFYNASPGSDRISNLQAFHNALDRVSEAVMTITGVIGAEQSVSFMGRRQLVADAAGAVRADLGRSRFKGELAGRGAKALRTGKRAVVYGNTTPVYFFKNLLNRGMDMIWKDMEWSENRNGLEMQRAKDFVGALAERTGYRDWSGQKMKVTLGGMAQEIGIENALELCAIWTREHTTNPEMSQHLAKGGVYIAEDEEESGKLRHERKQQQAWRVTDEEVAAMMEMLTPEQKEYMNGMVGYLSNEMSELGNEASMRMYGIKKYKEKYYFPMKVWDGVKSARSDKGITGTDENRAAHRSWSKRRTNRAKNALVIGNFTTDAVNHIVEMINYNTMAPAIENINKVLNYQFEEGANQDESTKRNLRIMFQEAYGKDALEYLETFMKDLNGGTVQDQRKTLRDRMLSVFKKNAVAGSLSVALQQPLSYIRAAMMINPKYLAQALNPTYWKGSHAEMVKYSGVAVIKDMGRFDMNFGQSAKDYVTPEGAMSKGRAVYEWISDKTTILPELMDRMTWTRMWSAVKAEQKAQNPEMDPKSDEFLEKVAERFNEVMRRTQVYDSVLVKSSNMRSQRTSLKLLTSFMAEPTLSLNVLADAVVNFNQAGGKKTFAMAGATFLTSAVFQAVVKALMGSGRSPDKKKRWEENFLNKFIASLISEADPLNLIPGFGDMVEVLKTGTLTDNAMTVLGKLYSIVKTGQKALQGEGNGPWQDLEDTVGQFFQLVSNVPTKNISRDIRAIRNWIVSDVYADRPVSGAVIKQQTIANLMSADNLIGVLNTWLGDAGYKTTNETYYNRIWNAVKAGDEQAEDELKEFMTAARGVSEKKITEEVNKRAKADTSMSALEKAEYLNNESYVMEQYKAGEIGREDAQRLLKEADRKETDDSIWWKLDRADFEKETGEKPSGSEKYYRLDRAIEDNAPDAEIEKIAKDMIEHGADESKVNSRLKKREGAAYDSFHAALKKGDPAAVEKAEQDLISQKLVTKSGLASKRKNYFINAFEEGEITRKQAEDGLKKFTDMAEDDVFWKIDKIDWMKSTGSNREPNDKYYRLDAAILNNKTEEISRAVKDMRAHGFTKDGVDNCIQYFKKDYLNATGDRKIKLRDALTKAYKANGMTADQALRTIDSWKTSKKKK